MVRLGLQSLRYRCESTPYSLLQESGTTYSVPGIYERLEKREQGVAKYRRDAASYVLTTVTVAHDVYPDFVTPPDVDSQEMRNQHR